MHDFAVHSQHDLPFLAANFHFLKINIVNKTPSQGRNSIKDDKKAILRRVCVRERKFLMINRHFHAS